MVFGAILAGGIGSRMRLADMPKQFLPLGDKPIIIHTLEKFLTCSKLEAVFIGIHADWVAYLNDLLNKYLLTSSRARVYTIIGGADRNESLLNVICAIENAYGESDEHIIVTHDAVRPFVTLHMIEENIECAQKYGAVNTVTPAVDTIVASTDGKVISNIPNRAELYQGQTPQTFRMSLLKELYLSLTDAEKGILTDACKICVVRNHPVYMVEGDYTNLKITTQSDYKIAQAIAREKLLD